LEVYKDTSGPDKAGGIILIMHIVVGEDCLFAGTFEERIDYIKRNQLEERLIPFDEDEYGEKINGVIEYEIVNSFNCPVHGDRTIMSNRVNIIFGQG
jgi:hypothetical protein